MRTFALLTLICILGRTECRSSDPAFVGFMLQGSRAVLAIRESPKSAASWVRVGDQIGLYTVESFDSVAGSVILRTSESAITLYLPESRVSPKVDIAVIESLVASGNQQLASLLDTYRKVEILRDSVNAALKNESASEYAEKLRRNRWKVDSTLTQIADRMQAEVAKLQSHRR